VDSSVVDMLDNIQIGIQYEDGMQWRTGAENPMMNKECTKKG